MKTLDEIKRDLREQRGLLAERYGVAVVGIFGSQVRGEARTDSDVDLLADIVRPISLFELVGAELYLSDLLGMKVDLVPKRSLRAELRDIIINEAVAL
ncbi:MAG: nucleotidyltransferase family protein [Chloroflexi bacterium]|nr:nucleotidyltransferase family protein [Chloroflexota bacterium]